MRYHVAFDIDFKRNEGPGRYIVLEGIDGSGKTTQVERLYEHFRSRGKEVVKTREPRKEGLIGDIIRRFLLGEIKFPNTALQYLFSADRVIHHEELILPALKEGAIVISDRCFWSAIVYGILDRTGEKYDVLETERLLVSQSILSMYHQFTVPDATFYLQISLQTALSRISGKTAQKEIYEQEGKLHKVIEGYEWMVKKFSREFTIIDGEQSIENVTSAILAKIK